MSRTLDPPAPEASDGRSLDDLARDASGCTRCALHASRTSVVFGEGDPDADLVFVGVAPGRSEDLQGRPFAGAAGNLLDNVLLENDLARDGVYVTNLVKCRPPDNRAPATDEIETCFPYLRGQLAHLAPKVVITLGDLPTRVVLGRSVPLEKVAGYRFPANGVTVIPTHDPTDALRGNQRAVAALRRDVRTAKGILDGRIAGAADAAAELRATHGAPAT